MDGWNSGILRNMELYVKRRHVSVGANTFLSSEKPNHVPPSDVRHGAFWSLTPPELSSLDHEYIWHSRNSKWDVAPTLQVHPSPLVRIPSQGGISHKWVGIFICGLDLNWYFGIVNLFAGASDWELNMLLEKTSLVNFVAVRVTSPAETEEVVLQFWVALLGSRRPFVKDYNSAAFESIKLSEITAEKWIF